MKTFIYSTQKYVKFLNGLIGLLLSASVYAQTITGSVYYDANNNGIREGTEFGFHGVLVKAYISNNTSAVANYTTDQLTGNYTLSGLITGTKYRIEFILPSGFSNSVVGGQSNTSVQFATAGDVNVNLGVHVASESNNEQNPRMIAGCGLISGMTTTMASWLYNDANNYPMNYSNTNQYIGTAHPHSEDMTALQVGVPFGIAAKPNTKYVYFSTIASPDATIMPPAPDGIGAIYVADYSGVNSAFVGYKLLMVVPNVAGTSFFGKYGLGGLDFSQDGKDLYVMNMGSGKLLKIDVSGVNYTSLPTTAPTIANITEISIPAAYSSCSGGTFRPVALREYGGKIYLGAVCDAFSSQVATDLRASIISYDFKTATWKEEFAFEPESFNAGNMIGLNVPQTAWIDPETISGLNPFKPVISDIAFDDTGSLIIGVTNRKFYNNNDDNYSTGYTIRAWRNADGTYTLENAGIAGPYTGLQTGISNIETTYGMDIGGPGNGYFFDQPMAFHPYVYSGGLYVKTGTGELIWGGADPVSVNSMGPRYLSLTNGTILKGLNLAGTKISRMTGLEAVSSPTPMSIGGRIWKDVNKNSVQDPDEISLSGVTVQLYDDVATAIATVTTDANGNYTFTSSNGTDIAGFKYNVALQSQTIYSVKVTSIGSNTGISLAGLSPTGSEPSSMSLLNSGATLANNDAFVNAGLPTIRLLSGAYSESNFTYDIGFGVCSPPTAIASVTQPSCSGVNAPNNAGITISGFTNERYQYSAGATFNSSSAVPASITAIPAGGIITNTLSNITGSYTVRIYDASDDACYIDRTVNITAVNCCASPTPIGTGANICAGNTATLTVSGCNATYPAVWYSDATLTSQVGTGNSFTTPILYSTTNYYVACVKDASCKSSGVMVTATVTPLPTVAAGSPVVNQATCNAAGTATNNDASILISAISDATVYAYTTDGTTPSFAGATAISGGIISLTNIANPSSPVIYKFRLFNSSATCYLDLTATLNPKTCTPTCTTPNAGIDVTICLPKTTTDLVDAPSGFQWVLGNGNPAVATINATTGVVSGLTVIGTYTFSLQSMSNSTCKDDIQVIVTNGNAPIALCNDGSTSYTLTAPANLTNVIWYNMTGTQVGTGNSLIVTSNTVGLSDGSESYYYHGVDGSEAGCDVELCCPVQFVTQNCCKNPNCGSVTIIKN